MRATLWERLWRKVRVGAPEACWEWQGALSRKRRGLRPVMATGRGRTLRMINVTRLVCEAVWGPAPSPDHHAGHTCPDGENCRCVNPNHLRWMTPEENQQWKATYRRRA